ncbi:hypothetical protein GCM10009784_13460 [Arthrobacter parietis]|uniref:Uncharacterized protein n=1 Tax=Arthrobacter parietis TaxID=271434 RepID=A0ABP5MNF5_9MICC
MQAVARQVRNRDVQMRSANVHTEYYLAAGLQRDTRGGTPAGRNRIIHETNKTEFHERLNAQRDGGTGKAHLLGELGPRTRTAIAQDLEQLARAG